MVPLTGCSQEPRHTNVSEGSVKLEDDSGETPLEISHHCKQDSSTDCPPLTPCSIKMSFVWERRVKRGGKPGSVEAVPGSASDAQGDCAERGAVSSVFLPVEWGEGHLPARAVKKRE